MDQTVDGDVQQDTPTERDVDATTHVPMVHHQHTSGAGSKAQEPPPEAASHQVVVGPDHQARYKDASPGAAGQDIGPAGATAEDRTRTCPDPTNHPYVVPKRRRSAMPVGAQISQVCGRNGGTATHQ